MSSKYDYVVVGAGSAGCVLANRLSANSDNSVLLIEAGPRDESRFIKIPKGFGILIGSDKYAHRFPTVPFGPSDDREHWFRGRTLGGSSAINGMIYNRGTSADWNDLADAGDAPDFAWEQILRHYKEIEDNQLGPSPTRGTDGPLGVSRIENQSPVMEAFIDAGHTIGMAGVEDINETDDPRVGRAMATILDGRRVSSAHAFLHPAESRPNLTLSTGTRVNRLLFEGDQVVGVEAEQDGPSIEIRGSEIILSTGSIATPKILQLSGIGPAEVLRDAGVDVRINHPNVGRRMVEHRTIQMQWRLNENIGDNKVLSSRLRQAFAGLKYLVTRGGVMAKPSHDVVGFLKTDPELDRPNAEILAAPYSQASKGADIESKPGIQCVAFPLRPTSEGSIEITSDDPGESPRIEPNYFATEHDRRICVGIVQKLRELMDSEPIADFIDHEIRPGPEVTDPEEIIDMSLEHGTPGYHAYGTCAMGPDGEDPVDSQLRVRGVEGLRTMDCSVLPTMVSGNLNGPMMAMASRAAEVILD